MARAISSLTSLSGCAFLFESHVGVATLSTKASSWTDSQSGSGLVAAQATNSKRPDYNAANANFNGYPTIDWALADVANVEYLETGALGTPMDQPITLLACVRCTDVAAGRIVVNKWAATTPDSRQENLLFNTSTGKVRLTGTTPPFLDSVTAPALGVPVVLVAVAQATIATIYANAQVIGYGPKGTGGLRGIAIGASSQFNSSPFVGAIATIAGWTRALAVGEVIEATNLLVQRYAIATSGRVAASGRVAL